MILDASVIECKDDISYYFSNLSEENLENNFIQTSYDEDTNTVIIEYCNHKKHKSYNDTAFYVLTVLKNIHGKFGNDTLRDFLKQCYGDCGLSVFKIAGFRETWRPASVKGIIELEYVEATEDPLANFNLCLFNSVISAHTLEKQENLGAFIDHLGHERFRLFEGFKAFIDAA